MITFIQFVAPAIRKQQGESHWQPMHLYAISDLDISSRRGEVSLFEVFIPLNEWTDPCHHHGFSRFWNFKVNE